MNTTPANTTLLGRLRAAVNKVVVILRHLSSTSTWPIISILHSRRPLSITNRHSSGLIDAIEDELYYDAGSAYSTSASTTPTTQVLHRTSSCPETPVAGEDEDIDRKAEEFIENFYRQLRIEKQVSLELRYCRGYNHSYSFESSSQISPYSVPSITSPTS